MTIIEFLKIVEFYPFIIYYYAFSMILSIVLGRFFLSRMGHPRIWNYFFSLLLYMVSVVGLFSLIVFFYQVFTHALAISVWDILTPFFTMIIAILLIRKRVNIPLVSGFGYSWAFFIVLFVILLLFFLLDYISWMSFSKWPVYLFLLFLVGITMIVQLVVRRWERS